MYFLWFFVKFFFFFLENCIFIPLFIDLGPLAVICEKKPKNVLDCFINCFIKSDLLKQCINPVLHFSWLKIDVISQIHPLFT